ncbi:hypothetical protein NDU88_007048 [Pleurodeles waltl]|uniref:Uncharacterized protein n=1 Tax=Pleurodeles waltl TaxID=8319 RepID=A0AAV7RTS5_PLEWA|nr:hypothetical protein NDU88_007048 [Pleurodeles waltl]
MRNARTGAEERDDEAHRRTRPITERTFSLLKARFRCLDLTGGSLCYSPEKEEETRDAPVAAVDPEDSEDEEDEDEDNRTPVIGQYFQ